MINMMIALAMLLVKKATIEPKLAFKSFVHIEILHKFNCKTATKGIMIMPNGGKTKQPTAQHTHLSLNHHIY